MKAVNRLLALPQRVFPKLAVRNVDERRNQGAAHLPGPWIQQTGIDEGPAAGIIAPPERDFEFPDLGRDPDEMQQTLAIRWIEIKLRRANALQFLLGRISEHAHDGVVAVEDSPVDGGVHDSGQISADK